MTAPYLAANLRRARLACGYTQVSASLRLGMTIRHISGLERGKAEPRCSELSRMATVYHTTLQRLLEPPLPPPRVKWCRNIGEGYLP